ncbi:hypothetical protein [Burkholderia ubonensis]|uniref:Type III effector protein n=1 Tax=Burkholderia ubonensis TaxID=101571 RepID=A0AB74DAZ8_9BURK|nr:hypothetical protein [Burkholderia ubonensis]PAJ76509.1 hypothetical protein CJO71_33880 [Burkholderia ubonensis]PAJ84173.1 hypothetical protein CJO70_29555 [Burkholderia ubonensis]PAJ91584.1 hypothetical protein CJO69_26820 [Burkholderia ubonensis]PAJ97976.1 hypothetical protein CJO68_27855 [Burkholderia ubonensis]PAK04826.1 hypothetical protein CJO67_26735 [Burkholderia ubonensis]
MLKSIRQSTQSSTVADPNRSASDPSSNRSGRQPRRSLGAFSHGQLRSARETVDRIRNDGPPRLPPRLPPLSLGEPLSLGSLGGEPPSPPPPPTPPAAIPQTEPPPPPATDEFRAPHPERQPGQAYDRSKPGFTLAETNGIRPLASLFNAAAAGRHGDVATGLAIGGLASGLAHETAGAGMNGHALFASWRKRRRYDRQLSAMRDRDVAAFRAAAIDSDVRRLDRLILARDRNGKLDYHLDKVMKLAASDDPQLAAESAHAKDVLLTIYIRHEVAGKRMNRAACELVRNALGIASGAALIAGTHGLAAAPASAAAVGAKQAGFALALLNALDIAKGVRGLKQRMRNDKAREIDRNALRNRMTFDARVISDATPDEVIEGIHAVLKDNGRIEANRQRFGKVFPGRWVNEKKSTANKDEMAELTAKHALTIIDRSIDRFAGDGPAKLHKFFEGIHVKNASTSQKKRALRDAIGKDDDLVDAYNLLCDLGMREGEARVAIESLIVRRIEIGLANDAATSRARATDAGRKYAEQAASGERAPDDVAAMRTVLQRR